MVLKTPPVRSPSIAVNFTVINLKCRNKLHSDLNTAISFRYRNNHSFREDTAINGRAEIYRNNSILRV